MKSPHAAMPPDTSLRITIILLTISTVHCQFEFNDQQIVYDFIVDAIKICEVSCVAIMRPPNENPQERSTIDRLTQRLAKESLSTSEYDDRIPTVSSYTTDLYEEFYMNPHKRQKDSCIFWVTVVMVNNSTNEQLAYLSESYIFDYPYWILFANRSELTTLFQNVHIRLSTKLFVVEDEGNGLFNASTMVGYGKKLGNIIWSQQGGFEGDSENVYPNIKGHTLNVGVLEVNRNQSGQITTVTGFYGDLWNDLQETLHFNSVYVEPEQAGAGSYDANGNWTGLYRLIAKKQADILLNEMTISQERHHIVDFLHPIERTKYKIFYQKDAEIFDWLKVFRPLDYPVWIALIIWIIVGGTAAYIVTTAEKNFQKPRRHLSLISCIYFVLRTLCCQGSEQVPKLWALRILFLTAYLTASIMLPSYSASLISVLTVKSPIEPFTELNDVLATDFKLSIESNSTDYDFFEKTSDPIHSKIYQKSVIKDNTKIEYEEAIAKACKNSRILFFGTLNEVTAVHSQGNMPCALMPLQSEISPAYKTIAVAKHSPYRLHLRKQLFRMMEKGLVNRYKRLYLPNTYQHLSENDIGIRFLDVGAIFIYFNILIALSVVIFCLELLSWKYQLKKPTVPYRVATKQKLIIWYGIQPPILKI